MNKKKNEYMSYATGHNSFTSQYLLDIYIYCRLQIMYNKCVKEVTIAPPLIYALCISLQHILNFLSLFSLGVSW
jgi:hypothetical protein